MKAPRIAVASLLCAVALAHTGCSEGAAPAPKMSSLELRDAMRELWTAHVMWTRVLVVDVAAGLPDTSNATDRLLRNQVDIGNAIRPFYGDAAADRLSSLLHDHITVAADVVVAAKAGDTLRLEAAIMVWYANADDIARFLADANPYWRYEDLLAMMRTHLDQTAAEAMARLHGDWEADIASYDAIVAHILHMSDALTDGIALQFPDRVSKSSGLTARDEALHLGMRGLWQDHVTWTRMFLISAIAGLPDVPAVSNRLLRNQDDLGNAVRPFYGDTAADRLTVLLHEHITWAVEVVVAAQLGDAARLGLARTAWQANADEIARFLASANPYWPPEDLRTIMRAHLDQTTAEATARLQGDWAGDIRAYDAIVTHILHMSDTLSVGLSAQFPEN